MDVKDPQPARRSAEFFDLAMRLGLVALLAWLALQVFKPFLALMVWAVVLAIALYPLVERLAPTLGGSTARAATALVLVLVLALGVPTAILTASFVDHMLDIYQGVAAGTYRVPAPSDSVAEWPLIGERVYAGWQAASENLAEFLSAREAQLRQLSRDAASTLGSLLTTILAFIGAFIIAGIMMAYAQSGAHTSARIFSRVCGPRVGPQLHGLTVATIRSVAVGVVGVAFIQAVLLGIGFLFAGIPAAGLLAVVVLFLGILQIPAALIVIPAIAWLWTQGDASTVMNVVISIYLLVAGLADNVLKPMLLGRGLPVPMPVVLLGALGGMVASGLIGLFVGAVILAVAYQVFMAWVDEGEPVVDADRSDS